MLPLLFGMAVVVPIQPYVQGLSNGLVQPGFGAFLLRYWTGGPWPAHAFDGWQYGVTWNHLWYLPYLWNYTLVLLMLLPLLESSVGQRIRARIEALRGPSLLILPAIPLFAAGMLLADRFPMTHALIGDWYAHVLYGTMFLYGYLLGTGSRLWDELARLRRSTLGVALASFGLFIVLDKFGGALLGHAPNALDLAIGVPLIRAAQFLYMWTAIAAVLGWGHVWLNRPFRWLPYAREAVYPWYILHQSMMLALAWWLMPLGLGAVGEPLVILLGTVAGCAVSHEIIRRTPWLRPLFGLDARTRPAQAPRVRPLLADDLA
jgi:hypothetical protein